MPSAYALIGSIAAGDVAAANRALAQTTALHCAAAGLVLARSPRSGDLAASLQLLALQAEIDEIAHNDENGTPR